MRSPGLYLVEAVVGALRISAIPDGELSLTLRIGISFENLGRSSSNVVYNGPIGSGNIELNSTIQLNCDNTAL